MNVVFWLSLVMAIAGCSGLLLAGKGVWQGWAIGLAVQPVWAAFAFMTKGYGLLITCVMYGVVYTKNLIRWRKENRYKSKRLSSVVSSAIFSPNEFRKIVGRRTSGGDKADRWL